MYFVRFGGLSKVKYKNYYKSGNKNISFHTPPVKRGIFAFIWPYIEPFLWVWKVNTNKCKTEEEINRKIKNANILLRRKFKYKGMLWTHFIETNVEGRRRGAWVEIHTSDIDDALKKQMQLDRKELSKIYKLVSCPSKNYSIINPYKRGSVPSGIPMSRDHLEVFIEKLN